MQVSEISMGNVMQRSMNGMMAGSMSGVISGSMDQAEGLRRIVEPDEMKIIAVSSGKGGVGKTNVSVNLAIAMAKQGKEVMLLDADLGLANVDVLLGLNTEYNLSHVMRGERTLEEIIVTGPSNIKVIPASTGISDMANLRPEEQMGLINAFSDLSNMVDVLIIDTGAGISDSVISFCGASQDVIVVVHDEPASITDAYAFIKVMSRKHKVNRFHILANMTHDAREGQELFIKLSKATDRFLDVVLSFLGAVPFDGKLRKAIQHQRAVVDAFPHSPASLAFKRITKQINNWPQHYQTDGQLKFFVERMIQANMLQANMIQSDMLQLNMLQPNRMPHSVLPQEVS
jgi:flagellar biosynthesis protein FlhG